MFVPIDSVDHADLLSFCDRCHVTPPGNQWQSDARPQTIHGQPPIWWLHTPKPPSPQFTQNCWESLPIDFNCAPFVLLAFQRPALGTPTQTKSWKKNGEGGQERYPK
jgi:hypothetical protein